MTLEEQLQEAYERAAERAPVSPGAYDRFLRRRTRRGRVVAAAAGLALVAVLGAAGLSGPPAGGPLPAGAGQPPACARTAWRVLLVSGAAAPGDTASRCWR